MMQCAYSIILNSINWFQSDNTSANLLVTNIFLFQIKIMLFRLFFDID